MKRLILLALLSPALASAQIRASFSLDLPVVLPQLVVIQPGIQVVPDVDYEVFHADGFYWTRRDGGWYRSTSPRAGWVYMPRGVPPGLTRIPPGHYKHWRPGPAAPGPRPAFRTYDRGGDRHEGRHERYEDHRGDRRERGHDDDRGGGRGKGHGKH
ncbi:MAG TPA: hypothetical protein VLT47_07825 [Anaeromyxobacteraceae bacterium]|nr:hypothetical protein [Anaeromyxobacteraceae bacterium]